MSSGAYLTHVNGLRAIAIIAILFYHLYAPYCPAGYYGVDLFLVVSGFFLFRKLMAPGTAESFRYGDYLVHKAWRILPPWFAVVLVASLVAVVAMVGSPALEGLRTARNSAFFLADFNIDSAGDYFNPRSQENPLLHLWYLSVICQFYIIAPLLVLFLLRQGARRAAQVLLAVLALLSLAYWVLTTTETLVPAVTRQTLLRATLSHDSYYHLAPRLWELLAGYAVVFLPGLAGRPRLRALLGAAGLVAILLSFYLYGTGSAYPYMTIAGALLAMKYGDSGWTAKLLTLKPVQLVGTISFSLYLWHWPVMVAYKYFCFGVVGPWDEAAMVAASFVAGYVSWRWVERAVSMPVADGTRKRALAKYAVLLAIPVMAGVSSWWRSSYAKKADNEVTLQLLVQNLMTPAQDFEYRYQPDDPALVEGFRTECFERIPRYLGKDAGRGPMCLVIGDSHAQHLDPGLDAAMTRHGRRCIALNNSVLPVWGYAPTGISQGDARWDRDRADALLAYLEKKPEIRYVVVSLYWKRRLFDNKGMEWDSGRAIPQDGHPEHLVKGLCETFHRIAAMGKKVIVVAETPVYLAIPPVEEWKRCWKLGRTASERFISRQAHAGLVADQKKYFDAMAADPAVRAVLDPAEPLLSLSPQGCPAQHNGRFLYVDSNHLSPDASAIVGEYIMQQLLRIEAEDAATPDPGN